MLLTAVGYTDGMFLNKVFFALILVAWGGNIAEFYVQGYTDGMLLNKDFFALILVASGGNIAEFYVQGYTGGMRLNKNFIGFCLVASGGNIPEFYATSDYVTCHAISAQLALFAECFVRFTL